MNLQANARLCFVCGVENQNGLRMRFYETGTQPVVVSSTYTVPRQFEGYPGIVHGGVVAAMLDEATTRTVMRGDPPRFAVTAQMTIRYRKPVPIETPLTITARVVKESGRVVTISGEIIGPSDVLLAEAETTVVHVDQQFFGETPPEDAMGWRIYPDDLESSMGGAG